MNPPSSHLLPTISPDFAAGPHPVCTDEEEDNNDNGGKPTTTGLKTTGGSSHIATTTATATTKIENPFDAFLTTPAVVAVQAPVVPPLKKVPSHNNNNNNNNWFSLMNEGGATSTMMDVFQLLPSRSGSSSAAAPAAEHGIDVTATPPTTAPLRPSSVPPPPILLEPKRSIDTTTTTNSFGFDPETYSYDEEMSAIYNTTATQQQQRGPPPVPLRTLSEEETYVTNESGGAGSTGTNHSSHASSHPNNNHNASTTHDDPGTIAPQSVITMTSLMTSSIGTNDAAAVLPSKNRTVGPVIVPPQQSSYPTFDYSDVAMMSQPLNNNPQQQMSRNATFDSGISSIGNDIMDVLELAPTTSSDIVRQHQHQNNTKNNNSTRMVSLGTGSVVVVETVHSATSDNEEVVDRPPNVPVNMEGEAEDDDEQLAARIMLVLQGAAGNQPTTTWQAAPSGEKEIPYLPSNQPHISMTDSQIYTCGSGTAGDGTAPRAPLEETEDIHQVDVDEDVDNLLPATISIPLSSSLSPLSQQQQERQHIVLNPVFNYASSSDDGENDAIHGFFGDTDTEDDDPVVVSNRIAQQQQQQEEQERYGPIPVPHNNTVRTTDPSAPFPTVPPQDNPSHYNNSTHWSNATPAVAMTAAGLTTAAMMIHPNHNSDIVAPSTLQYASNAAGAVSPPGMESLPRQMINAALVDPLSSSSSPNEKTIPQQYNDNNEASSTLAGNSSHHPNHPLGGFPQHVGNDHDEHDVKDVNDSEQTKKRWMSSYSCLLCFGLLFILVGIALLIYFLVRDDNTSRSDNAVPVSPMAPTVVSVPTPLTSPTAVTVPAPVTTLTPSMVPTMSIRDELFLQLQSVSADNGMALNMSGTPQSMAFAWLLLDPQLTEYSADKRIVRYALATFFYSTGGNTTTVRTETNLTTNSTTTPPTLWLDNYLWLSYEDECNWYTRARTGLCGTTSSTNNNTSNNETINIRVVQNLDVSYNNLQGTIPPEIGLLSTLQTFSVGGGPNTALVGSLPSELAQLSLLEELRLPYNQMTGRIPASMGACTLLQSIDLSNNHFRGLIPSDLGMMTNLLILSLDHNAFQGPIPTTIGQCTGMKTLNLAHNTLSLLSTELYQLSNLIFLDLQNNTLGGPLDETSELGSLSNINTILLSHNQLTGTLPTEFNLLSKLKVLDLSYNMFTGTIPYAFVFDNVTTTSSNSSSNIFTPSTNETTISSLPSSVVNPLRVLQLNNNRLSGMVPESFRELSNIQVLQLHSNLFNGSIPTEVCEVFNITRATVSVDCINVDCPCCIFCCNMDDMLPVDVDASLEDVCTCRHWNTTMEWLCY